MNKSTIPIERLDDVSGNKGVTHFPTGTYSELQERIIAASERIRALEEALENCLMDERKARAALNYAEPGPAKLEQTVQKMVSNEARLYPYRDGDERYREGHDVPAPGVTDAAAEMMALLKELWKEPCVVSQSQRPSENWLIRAHNAVVRAEAALSAALRPKE